MTTSPETLRRPIPTVGINAKGRIISEKVKQGFHQSTVSPLERRTMSGSTFRTTKAQMHISPAAIKYISRHPNSSPTQPLTTLEANIPVSRPEMTTPTLRPLCSGREYWKRWEQIFGESWNKHPSLKKLPKSYKYFQPAP